MAQPPKQDDERTKLERQQTELLVSIASGMKGLTQISDKSLDLQLDMLTLSKEEMADKLRKERLGGVSEDPAPTVPDGGTKKVDGLIGALKGFVDDNGGKLDLFKKVALAAAVAPFVASFLDRVKDNVITSLFGEEGDFKREAAEATGDAVVGAGLGAVVAAAFKKSKFKGGLVGLVGGLVYGLVQSSVESMLGEKGENSAIPEIAGALASGMSVALTAGFFGKIFKKGLAGRLAFVGPLAALIAGTDPFGSNPKYDEDGKRIMLEKGRTNLYGSALAGVDPKSLFGKVLDNSPDYKPVGGVATNRSMASLQTTVKALSSTGLLPDMLSINKAGRVMIRTSGNFKGFASAGQIVEILNQTNPQAVTKYSRFLKFLNMIPPKLLNATAFINPIVSMMNGEKDAVIIEELTGAFGGLVGSKALGSLAAKMPVTNPYTAAVKVLAMGTGFIAGDSVAQFLARQLITGDMESSNIAKKLNTIRDPSEISPQGAQPPPSDIQMSPSNFTTSVPVDEFFANDPQASNGSTSANVIGGNSTVNNARSGDNINLNVINGGGSSLSNDPHLPHMQYA